MSSDVKIEILFIIKVFITAKGTALKGSDILVFVLMSRKDCPQSKSLPTFWPRTNKLLQMKLFVLAQSLSHYESPTAAFKRTFKCTNAKMCAFVLLISPHVFELTATPWPITRVSLIRMEIPFMSFDGVISSKRFVTAFDITFGYGVSCVHSLYVWPQMRLIFGLKRTELTPISLILFCVKHLCMAV